MSQPLGCFSVLVSFIGSGRNSPYRGWIKQEEPPSSLVVRFSAAGLVPSARQSKFL